MRQLSPVFKSHLQDGYYRPQVNICGWNQFCSGGIIHGVGAQVARGTGSVTRVTSRIEQKDFMLRNIPVQSMPDYPTFTSYWQWVKDNGSVGFGATHFALPMDMMYASILEVIYIKARDGKGGNNMYGHGKYPCKTFAIADRYDKLDEEIHCWGLQNYLMKLSRRRAKPIVQYAQMKELVPGAHGGMCRGALFSFIHDKPWIECYWSDMSERLQSHVKWLKRRHKYTNRVVPPKVVGKDASLQNDLVNGW